MKLGLGLYRRMLTADNFRFARQAGCTHIVAHLVDYFREGRLHGTDGEGTTWGVSDAGRRLWSEEELAGLKKEVNAARLELAAIENFDPAHWHDVLLDGPRKQEQLENIKVMIRRMGRVGIPVMGYNFSIAGVWGHVEGPYARGGAVSVGFLGPEGPRETPIPLGQVWNMVYDPHAPAGTIGPISSEQLWSRFEEFLGEVVPVAEEAGVRLALHPDDPPMPVIRDTARLVYQPGMYDRVLGMAPSPANALEFCVGSVAEMFRGDIYQALDNYSRRKAIAYVHLRNVVGKVPSYREVFIDEGDVDVSRILRILCENRYEGVIVPDHTPQMLCGAPWHAGMAHALGFIAGAIRSIQQGS